MEELKNEQAELRAQAVETENISGDKESEASFGKFKDADALIKAYNSLQAEFTKRCQRIKELEANRESGDKTEVPSDLNVDVNKNVQGITDKEKQEILKDYLKEVLGSQSKAIVMDKAGSVLKTPIVKPKTIEEAGELAREIFSK